MNRESTEADRAIAPDDLDQRPMPETRAAETRAPARSEDDSLEPLFSPDAARDFRANWDAVQISFVDDPKQAVRQADQLVRQVLDDLGQTFSSERNALDGGTDTANQASTENLRLALRRYRSFFQRLLSL
ncbi:hypothetical protein ASC78_17090 [Variovorax sp. Root318D1]|uniref:hypothetical protein n=1 Tax=Variovorax sp. Root318D1 TaxID=1736513 RepID=UPI0006F5DA45|nr:hypothetical protein [Variovorax sp. Root318D1]KQU82316.1 hypothetical protein ASC78_17090 [Variovorax sp. Root318D1]